MPLTEVLKPICHQIISLSERSKIWITLLLLFPFPHYSYHIINNYNTVDDNGPMERGRESSENRILMWTNFIDTTERLLFFMRSAIIKLIVNKNVLCSRIDIFLFLLLQIESMSHDTGTVKICLEKFQFNVNVNHNIYSILSIYTKLINFCWK